MAEKMTEKKEDSTYMKVQNEEMVGDMAERMTHMTGDMAERMTEVNGDMAEKMTETKESMTEMKEQNVFI